MQELRFDLRTVRSALFLGCVVALALLPTAALAETGGEPLTGIAADLDNIFTDRYDPFGPGATVIITRDGETLLRKGYGMADMEHNIALQPDMVFRIGSITKQFTAVAVLMLEQEGKLKVSDEIQKYIPSYPKKEQPITVEHLLTHTSGIPSYTSIPGWMTSKIREDLSVSEMIDEWDDMDLEFEPGTQWKYNNSGYFMLGAVIEAASGMSYGDFIEKKIFAPLEMQSSFYDSETRIILKRVQGYQPQGAFDYANAPFLDMDQPGAAGGLMSTVDDLAKWDAALYTDKLLSAEARERLWTSYKLADGEDTGYGYGWAVGEHNGKRIIHHSGGIFGFATLGIRVPEEKLYIAVLSNGHRQGAGGSAQQAALAMLGDPYDFKAVPMEAKDLERFVGVYRMDEENVRVVTVENGQLFTQRTGGPKLPAMPMGDNSFFYPDSTIRFRFDTDGDTVKAMEMFMWAAPVAVAPLTDEEIPQGPQRADVDPAVYEKLAGRYEIMAGFILEVRREGDKIITQATGQVPIEIHPASETVYFNETIGAKITFQMGDDGQATALVLEQAGQRMEAPKLD